MGKIPPQTKEALEKPPGKCVEGKRMVNGVRDENREAEKRIKEYIEASAKSLSKKEERAFKELVLQNEETAKEVFRSTDHTGKAYILIYLNAEGKGADIAKEEAAAWAARMEFTDISALKEQAFCAWLSGETDVMPETMPANKYLMGFPYRKNVELCYLSKVCTFTERLTAYGIKKGYVDMVRGPVREMIREIGISYAYSFLEHTVRMYQISEEDVMQMYSAIYAGAGKAKSEKEFYRSFLDTWLEQDSDSYVAAIEKISKDMRKKIFAILKREGMYPVSPAGGR